MKALPLLVFCAVALTRPAFGQAFGESIQLSQPAVKKTGAAVAVPTSPLSNSRSGLPQQGGVQVVNDMYRGLPDCHCAPAPMFLPSPREVPSGTAVVLSSPNPNAVIYYTTDGWTPTESSAQYRDPIMVTANTRVQAFAQEPGKHPVPSWPPITRSAVQLCLFRRMPLSPVQPSRKERRFVYRPSTASLQKLRTSAISFMCCSIRICS